jgi:hypothetical protein
MLRKIFFSFLAIFMFLLFSCQNNTAWYPAASITVNSSEEISNGTTMEKSLATTLLIHNTGKISILNSTITVQVRTNVREYLQTVTSDIKINPGGNIVLTITIPYLNYAETILADGVTIYDSFFE